MPPTLTRTDEALELDLSTCRGAEFSDVLAKVRDLPGRRYEGKRKVWQLPVDPAIAERLVYATQPEVSPKIIQWIRDSKQQAEKELVNSLPEDASGLLIPWAYERAPWQPTAVRGEPFTGLKAHQRALVAALVDGDRGAIVADDMGLGKTGTAISTAAEIAIRKGTALWSDTGFSMGGPHLVVCPNSVKGVWAREIELWLGDNEAVVIDATTPKARKLQLVNGIQEEAWVIVNYEQMRTKKIKVKTKAGGEKTKEIMKEPLFAETKWQSVIADEAHRAKNRKAAQTRGLFRAKGELELAATGTPIMNNPAELWALLHWLYPKEYTSYWRFFEQYTDYTEGYFGRVIEGVKNPDALRFELKDKLYRRTKAQVLDLPPKMRITIPVKLGAKQRKLYEQAEKELWLEVETAIQEGDKTAEALAQAAVLGRRLYSIPNGAARTVRLRQILSTPSLLGGIDESAKLDAVTDSIEDNKHKQHVVFSEFVDTCNILAGRLRSKSLNVAVYTGETDQRDRAALEDSFQRGEIDVIVGTIGAMKEGLTLTAADTVHFVERSWVPGWNEQAEDRLHRIGQRNSVTILIYQATRTVDDGRIAPTNRLKESIVKTVLPKDFIKET